MLVVQWFSFWYHKDPIGINTEYVDLVSIKEHHEVTLFAPKLFALFRRKVNHISSVMNSWQWEERHRPWCGLKFEFEEVERGYLLNYLHDHIKNNAIRSLDTIMNYTECWKLTSSRYLLSGSISLSIYCSLIRYLK